MEKRKKLERVRQCKGCGRFIEVDNKGKIKRHTYLISGKWCEEG